MIAANCATTTPSRTWPWQRCTRTALCRPSKEQQAAARHTCRTPHHARSTVTVNAGDKGVYTVTLVLQNSHEAVFRAGTSRSLLDVASYAGVHLPASCKQGSCTACCAKLLAGRVRQPRQTCLPPALVKQGYVALCCATPASDVKLLTHQGAAVRKWKAEQPAK